jgi:hypothetical protein
MFREATLSRADLLEDILGADERWDKGWPCNLTLLPKIKVRCSLAGMERMAAVWTWDSKLHVFTSANGSGAYKYVCRRTLVLGQFEAKSPVQLKPL